VVLCESSSDPGPCDVKYERISQPSWAPERSSAAQRPRAKRIFGVKQEWYLELLETCRALAGLPVLVTLILQALDWQVKNIGRGAAAAVIVALILRFFPRVRRMLKLRRGYAFWSALPWFLTSALVIVLIFKVLPARSKRQNEESAKNVSTQLANAWLDWQRILEQATTQCKPLTQKAEAAKGKAEKDANKVVLKEKLDAEEARDRCLAAPLDSVLAQRQQLARPSPTNLASDVVAGYFMLANETTKTVLWDRLSVSDKFLGNGFSVPIGENGDAARVPEYLVPNLRDQSAHVWRWDLKYGGDLNQKPILGWKLTQLLLSVSPARGADFRKDWDEWVKGRLQQIRRPPVLVRFALMDQLDQPPSGCLGRPDATRVFMSDLRELGSKSVTEAAQSTGYFKPIKTGEPGQTLFIWVYAPEEGEQVYRANWENVLKNFGVWIKEEPCKTQS